MNIFFIIFYFVFSIFISTISGELNIGCPNSLKKISMRQIDFFSQDPFCKLISETHKKDEHYLLGELTFKNGKGNYFLDGFNLLIQSQNKPNSSDNFEVNYYLLTKFQDKSFLKKIPELTNEQIIDLFDANKNHDTEKLFFFAKLFIEKKEPELAQELLMRVSQFFSPWIKWQAYMDLERIIFSQEPQNTLEFYYRRTYSIGCFLKDYIWG
jgi:hypothetical protein